MALADLAQVAAGSPHGRAICGVFNMNRTQAVASLRRLADLDVTIVCFGHGEPLTHAAATDCRRPPPAACPPTPVRMPVTAAAPSSRQSTGPALSGKTHARSALASLDAIYR